jgi:hypothetical protein
MEGNKGVEVWAVLCWFAVGTSNFFWWGETESTSYVGHYLFGLLYQPRMIDDDECRAVCGMTRGRGN